jgi:hypothetical protein
MSSSIDAAAVLIDHYQWERNLQKIVAWDHHTHWLGPWIR